MIDRTDLPPLRRLARGVMALALCLGVAVAAQPSVAQPQTIVTVDATRVEPMRQTVALIARFVAKSSSVVAARVAAPVDRMLVDVGDRVDLDQPLAVLDTAQLEAAVALATAEVGQARALLEAGRASRQLAQQERERAESLRQSAAYSQARFDDAVQNLRRAQFEAAEAQAALARAESQLTLARIDLDHAVIRAPFPGVVSEKLVSRGEFVTVGSAVARVVNDTDLEVEAAVPTNRLAGLESGATVDLLLDDGRRYEALVRAVVPVEDIATRTRAVRFLPNFDEAPEGLAADQSLTVYIPAGPRADVLTVHKDAVLARPDGRMVFVVGADGTAAIRPIEIGASVGSRFQVLRGLEPGENVVIRGNERLRPGQPVAVAPPAT